MVQTRHTRSLYHINSATSTLHRVRVRVRARRVARAVLERFSESERVRLKKMAFDIVLLLFVIMTFDVVYFVIVFVL